MEMWLDICLQNSWKGFRSCCVAPRWWFWCVRVVTQATGVDAVSYCLTWLLNVLLGEQLDFAMKRDG